MYLPATCWRFPYALASVAAVRIEPSSQTCGDCGDLGAYYGWSGESYQSYIPGREPSVFDCIAHVVGETPGSIMLI